jgi:D-3-phosphoglycerate dehydrogenase
MTTLRTILVTTPNFDADAVALLAGHDCVVLTPAMSEGALSQADLIALLAQAQGWIIGPQANVTRALIAASPSCRVFSRRGVGYERVDTNAINELGRVATIATGGNEASVADHVIGLMLAVGRRMREQQIAMLSGDWSIRVSTDLYGKTVGIIGLGRTGRALVQRLSGFAARVLAVAPRPDIEFCRNNNVTLVDLNTLLRECDYVSVHAPLTAETKHMIGANELAMMKPSGILINAGRGGLVDDVALLNALRAGKIAGAGLDVYEGESDPALKSVAQELLALPNVVGTPHAAASTREGLARTNLIAARNVIAVLNDTPLPLDCVVADGR